MPKERSLRAALDRHQGKDYKLEKQKKLQKDAQKKKRQQEKAVEDVDEDDEMEESGGVPLAPTSGLQRSRKSTTTEAGMESGASSEDEGWEDDDSDIEEEGETIYDISKLDDSESESEEDEPSSVQNVKQTNGTKTGRSLAEQLQSLVQTNGEEDGMNGENIVESDAEEIDEDASSVALSDISAAEDTEDLIPHQRLTINNKPALAAALNSFRLPYSSMTFSEYQTVTSAQPTTIPDIDDDLNRELAFYAQSLAAAKTGRQLLKKEGVPFTRPPDFFAEMVKSDEHMGKIKAKLVEDAASKKASAEARKQRDLKKFGKQVQQEKLKERAKAKKDMLEKVNILKRKRQSGGAEGDREEDMFDVALEDAATQQKKDRAARKQKVGAEKGGPNAKRQKKNEKFGFGGKKRYSKSGDAASSADMSGFSVKKMKGQTTKKKGGTKRLGKSKRAKM